MAVVNGRGPVVRGAVDLAAVRDAQLAREQAERRVKLAAARVEQQRDVEQASGDAATRALQQAGLVCGCGERIKGGAVQYVVLTEQAQMTPQGPQAGLAVRAATFHSKLCPLAVAAERTALARRPVPQVTWLDERRAADASPKGPRSA